MGLKKLRTANLYYSFMPTYIDFYSDVKFFFYPKNTKRWISTDGTKAAKSN